MMIYVQLLRAWLSGITGPCQGPVGVSITPARTKISEANFCWQRGWERVGKRERPNFIHKMEVLVVVFSVEEGLGKLPAT